MKNYTIAIDCMGSDAGINMVIQGIDIYLKQYIQLSTQQVKLRLFGNESEIKKAISHYKNIQNYYIIHTNDIISHSDSVRSAIRKQNSSSMGMAINDVKLGNSDCVLSAGNTGAYLLLAKKILNVIDGISRPALVSRIPTIKTDCIMLDLGANISCDEINLYDFAIMGSIFYKILLNKSNPNIGILNIGKEDTKASAVLKIARQNMINGRLNFYGFVEPNEIMSGNVDIFVTDGFMGNMILKSIEGSVSCVLKILKKMILQNGILSKIGALFMNKTIQSMKNKFSPHLYNGALFLGLQHCAIKSHGGADALSFANAINVALNSVESNIIDKIKEQVSKIK